MTTAYDKWVWRECHTSLFWVRRDTTPLLRAHPRQTPGRVFRPLTCGFTEFSRAVRGCFGLTFGLCALVVVGRVWCLVGVIVCSLSMCPTRYQRGLGAVTCTYAHNVGAGPCVVLGLGLWGWGCPPRYMRGFGGPLRGAWGGVCGVGPPATGLGVGRGCVAPAACWARRHTRSLFTLIPGGECAKLWVRAERRARQSSLGSRE